MSYLGHSVGESYPSAEKQLVNSKAPVNLAYLWKVVKLFFFPLLINLRIIIAIFLQVIIQVFILMSL